MTGIHIQSDVADDPYQAPTYCGKYVRMSETVSRIGWSPHPGICPECMERAQAERHSPPRRIKWLGGPGGELKRCSECDNVTRYWAVETDVPLCTVCARRYP